MDRTLLETPRLRLRAFNSDDLDRLVDLDSDPEVMHFITGGVATPRVEMETVFLPHWMRYDERAPGIGFWAAEERASDEFVGWFHLRPGDGHPATEPEIGYRLRRATWGRGYATEGSRALIDWAFVRLGAERVLAETMAVHWASRRVMEKAGLRLVREFRADWPYAIPGDEHGDVEYGLDRAEWQAAREAGGIGSLGA